MLASNTEQQGEFLAEMRAQRELVYEQVTSFRGKTETIARVGCGLFIVALTCLAFGIIYSLLMSASSAHIPENIRRIHLPDERVFFTPHHGQFANSQKLMGLATKPGEGEYGEAHQRYVRAQVCAYRYRSSRFSEADITSLQCVTNDDVDWLLEHESKVAAFASPRVMAALELQHSGQLSSTITQPLRDAKISIGSAFRSSIMKTGLWLSLALFASGLVASVLALVRYCATSRLIFRHKVLLSFRPDSFLEKLSTRLVRPMPESRRHPGG